MKSTERIQLPSLALAALLGLLTVSLIESRLLAAEMVIGVAFLINIVALHVRSTSVKREKASRFSASMLFGALVGLIVT